MAQRLGKQAGDLETSISCLLSAAAARAACRDGAESGLASRLGLRTLWMDAETKSKFEERQLSRQDKGQERAVLNLSGRGRGNLIVGSAT